ncbi:fibrillarin-like rRNA/tRNA 2'-O-methyltransferase [Candidatus Bathyarchaeota archaeon]|nr:MAG: fibrillarin-like rRNA/tRNA 2'-O-methyltransferase [Candidatus Bathyarchaeota archaeon]
MEDGSRKLATKNLAPGRTVYGERLVKFLGEEYRIWDPYRSKLAAAILKGLTVFPIKESNKVLYLGAATGTTASHVSDVVGKSGRVYCVEFAERVIRELVSNVCTYRSNMVPILADARHPESYRFMVEKVDFIYCDVAQPEQAKILADNAEIYLKQGSMAALAVKARSIDVTKLPSEVFKHETQVLEYRGFKKIEAVNLEPYDKAHSLIVAEYIGV